MIPKKLTVQISRSPSGFTAVCQEFGITGSGETQKEALDCLVMALRTTLAASAASLKRDPENIRQFAEVNDLCAA